jgi:RecJ-like exonuclease
MTSTAKTHFHHLDLFPGASLSDVRKSYRDLTFIWHPDRHPDHLKNRAQEKLQAINEAYKFFSNFPEALLFNEEEDDFFQCINKGKLEDSHHFSLTPKTCQRCHGSGKMAKDVNWKGGFVHDTCEICDGKGRIFVDPRHQCHDCDGDGLNSKVDHEERQTWIDAKLKSQQWWTRNLNPVEYKKLWLKFHHNHLICGSCRGSGYALFRQDYRQDQRRLECDADFLHHLHHDEQRKNDRRVKIS